MKKHLKKIIILVLILGTFFGTKAIFKNNIINHEKIVNDALNSFYISGSSTDLKPVIELLNKYKNNDEKRVEIQSISYNTINSWYNYLNEKYLCDTKNVNACTAQENEIALLNSKLETLYNTKAEESNTIISATSYSSLKSSGSSKIVSIQKIINTTGATSPRTKEETDAIKCLSATCEERCSNTTCTCYYYNQETHKSEELTCKK